MKTHSPLMREISLPAFKAPVPTATKTAPLGRVPFVEEAEPAPGT